MSLLAPLAALGIGSSIFANAQNQSNFDEQLAFSKWQYKDMARRQDPVYQVGRLRAAGLNPALNAGNVQLGQAVGSSQPSPNPMQSLDLSGLSALGNGLELNDATKRNVESQTSKNVAEAEGVNIDNLFRAEDWKSKIYGRDMQSWLNEQLSEAAKLDVQFNKDSLRYRVNQQRYQMELLNSQVVAQDLANHYFPFEITEKISTLMSEQFANYASGRSSLHMAHQNLMRLFAEVGSTPKERSRFFNATLDALVQQKEESKARERSYDRVQTPFSAGPTGVRYDNVYTYNKRTGRYDRQP